MHLMAWRRPYGMPLKACKIASAGVDQPILNMLAKKQRLCANSVGISEISNFAKYLVTGADARPILIACLPLIPPIGRMTLAPMLKEDGRVIGDFSRTP